MADLTPYIQKINLADVYVYSDPREAFLKHLQAEGFQIKAVEVGNIKRINGPQDNKGRLSGWYIYNEYQQDEGRVFAVASYGDWRTDEKHIWTSKPTHLMSAEERWKQSAHAETARAQQEVETAQRQNEAAQRALDIWESAGTGPHEYLERKGVQAYDGIRVSRGALIVPMYGTEGLQSLQFIQPDGAKKFLSGGKVKGAFFKIDGTGTAYVTEGYATAASIAMATGAPVYAAFSASNLYEVAQIAKAQHGAVIIAGDDDHHTAKNVGRSAAIQAAEGLGLEVVFPVFKDKEGNTDFNDLHKAEGMKTLKAQLVRGVIKHEPKEVSNSAAPSGFLGDVYDYYNATSGNKQYGFAVQTALALGSIVCARSYVTNKNNYASLYLMNVGKSSTGKEHSRTVIEDILAECGMAGLIAGDGYTSGGSVFSTLLDRPRHISIIDEFGRYLEASSNGKSNNLHQREANTKLMEAIGRCHSVMRPPSYSTMTLKKDAANELKNRVVYNPAVTLLTTTTPVTLFNTLDTNAIKDGFINRFVISISEAERAPRQHKDPLPVPEKIKSWIRAVTERASNTHIAAEQARAIVIGFSDKAIALQDQFQLYCIDEANQLERFGMSELTGRSNEMAMRIALICALSENPDAELIDERHMQWGIDYVRQCYEKTASKLKMSLSNSQFEGHKKQILTALRDSADWVKFSSMCKQPPYSEHQRKYLNEILESLVDAELADVRTSEVQGRGRPTKEYIAI